MEKLFAAISQTISPFKLLLVGYIILLYTDKLEKVKFCHFIIIGLIFVLGEILHNDFLRIVLNNLGAKCFKPNDSKINIDNNIKKEST